MIFLLLWVAESPTGPTEEHSLAMLLHTPVMFTSVHVGSWDRTPSVISVGEVCSRQQEEDMYLQSSSVSQQMIEY